ncbi:MAG: ATP-grasp domain-containing protein [Isosphaeraceae bacterium]
MGHVTKKLIWVVGAGGPPFEYALPRMADRADVYALVATTTSALQNGLLDKWCAEVVPLDLTGRKDNIILDIVRYARRLGADGIITFSEFGVIAVAEACLNLGLPGPGHNARLARDKWLMRKRWREEGLPVPRFTKVTSLDDLEAAARTLKMPFLLKSSGRGGGIGQKIIDADTSLPQAMNNVDAALERAAEHGIVEYSGHLDVAHWVAEEIIESTTDSWYPDPRYGDFLSIEGVVARGVYHPICITSRLPTLPPFAEIGALSPCVLREDLQRKIEELASRSVNALGLDTCGTHTEIKLMSGGRMCLLETAARLGGSTATTLAEAVFGVDLIGLQTAEALGLPTTYPERMLVGGNGAAASIFLFAADSAGKPWASETEFTWRRLDWGELVSQASHVEIIPSQMVLDGHVITPYHQGSGALNYAGSVLLYSPDPETLLADSYRLIDSLEGALLARGLGTGRESDPEGR